MAKRLAGRFGYPAERPFTPTFHPDRLAEPGRVRKPTKFFVNSMSDLFHEEIPWHITNQIFAVMKGCKRHTFQVLTKRPKNMLHYFEQVAGHENLAAIAPNIWLGISAEDQATLDQRAPLLLQAPANVRWVSLEPLLGPIDVTKYFFPPPFINWVVVGGESGPHARPMHPDWVRSIRDQCDAAKVPFFFKQWGEWAPHYYTDGTPGHRLVNFVETRKEIITGDGIAKPGPDRTDLVNMRRLGKKATGYLLDGKEHHEFPIPF